MSVRSLPIIAIVIGLLAGQVAGSQQDLVGTWTGQWERDGSTLDVEVTFTRDDGILAGSFSSPQLRVVGIPFERVRLETSRVSWAVVGDSSTMLFDGTMHGDSLAGRYEENGASGSFRLTRRTSAVPLVLAEELTFQNGPVTLSGSLIRPAGTGPFPCVVFLHGSGAEGRWASRFLADAFARNGIAALIYDKRGVGASKGNWRDAGFAELVGDAAAAVEAMRSRPGIDPARIGIHGHSQGGTIAPWVAAESPHVAFVVGSAASGVSMVEAEIFSLENAVGLRGLNEAERALAARFVRAVVKTAYEGAPREELDSISHAVRGKPWAFELPPASDSYWVFSRRIASYAPLDHWRRVAVPVLLLYGEGDERVPARASAARIAESYLGGRGTTLTVHTFPGADHTFRMRSIGNGKFAWPRSAPGYPAVVINWVVTVTSVERK